MRAKFLVGEVATHRRKTLTHWDAQCGIQFVTIHLADGRMFDRAAAAIVADVIVRGDSNGCELLAWCVMPDHAHVVFRPTAPLPAIVQGWKGISAKWLGGGTWWQPDYFDRLIRDSEELARTVDYVINNPEKAGLADWDFRKVYPERLAECM